MAVITVPDWLAYEVLSSLKDRGMVLVRQHSRHGSGGTMRIIHAQLII